MLVLVVAVRVAVVDDIEPVPGPALAVAGRGEHPLDEVFVGGRVSVGDEGIDLFRCRREAEEIEGEAADECPSVGHGRGPHPFGSERGPHEGVDRVAVGFDARKRLKSLHRRRGIGVADRLPGPMVQTRVAVGVPFGVGPGEAIGQPGTDARDLVGRERGPSGGHPFVGVGGTDPVEELPLGTVSRNGDGAIFAPTEDAPTRIEPQAPFLRVLAMAFDTPGHEQRPGAVMATPVGGYGRLKGEQQPDDDHEPATDRQQQNHDSPPDVQFTLRRDASMRGVRPGRFHGQERIPRTTCPWTSVRRRLTPLW